MGVANNETGFVSGTAPSVHNLASNTLPRQYCSSDGWCVVALGRLRRSVCLYVEIEMTPNGLLLLMRREDSCLRSEKAKRIWHYSKEFRLANTRKINVMMQCFDPVWNISATI